MPAHVLTWSYALLLLALYAVFTALMWRSRMALRGTTLTVSAGWAVAGGVAGLSAALAEAFVPADRAGWIDALWYATAVILLCPGIGVLGARRPGAGAWTFFVLVPLLLVLLWPVAAARRVVTAGAPLELEEPATLAWLLVLVMAAGNYFGTRHTGSALLASAGLVLMIGPCSAFKDWCPPAAESRGLAAVLLLAAAGLARFDAGRPEPDHPCDPVWRDFLDTFGMVWPKRVLERINEAARHENWPVRLDWHGFVRQPGRTSEEVEASRARVEEMLRWALKRFVDPEWIDARLVAGAGDEKSGG